jgi:DNA-binding transcriptional regulator YiaG
MKYESDILEMIHESATEKFQLGFISEAKMREYDELCLTPETSNDNTAQGDIAHKTANIEHVDFVTV